jgi:hypothetical protein
MENQIISVIIMCVIFYFIGFLCGSRNKNKFTIKKSQIDSVLNKRPRTTSTLKDF